MALVFIAGPLSGLIVQPLIGPLEQSLFAFPIVNLLWYRCHGRQLQVSLWPEKTIHRRGRGPQLHGAYSLRIHSKLCLYRYNMGIFCCIHRSFQTPSSERLLKVPEQRSDHLARGLVHILHRL